MRIYLCIIGLLRLASKRVLSGSDCLKIDGGWGFAPDPTGGAYSTPQTPYMLLRGPTFKEGEGAEAKGKMEGNGEGERKWKGIGRVGLKPSQSQISGYITGKVAFNSDVLYAVYFIFSLWL